MADFILNNCYLVDYDIYDRRITYDTWDEFYTANKDKARGPYIIDICCDDGYKWTKTHADGTFAYQGWPDAVTVYISDGAGSNVSVKYNPNADYGGKNDDTEVSLNVGSSSSIIGMLRGINATPTPSAPPEPEEPPKPDKPAMLKTYPDEVLENVHIDNWRFFSDWDGGYYRKVETYDTVKEFLNESYREYKEDFTLQAQAGFNFALDDSDGYIKFYNGEKHTFKYMWDNGIPVGNEHPYNSPDVNRKRKYPDARKFIFSKGDEYSDGVDEFIVIRRYDKETIDIDLLGWNDGNPLIEMMKEPSSGGGGIY